MQVADISDGDWKKKKEIILKVEVCLFLLSLHLACGEYWCTQVKAGDSCVIFSVYVFFCVNACCTYTKKRLNLVPKTKQRVLLYRLNSYQK